MAFRKKFHEILKLKPDLLVLQEVEYKEKLEIALQETGYDQILWFGRNMHKGVAVISFKKLGLKLHRNYNDEFEYIIPLRMRVNDKKINLFCIWAMPHESERAKDYVGQIFGAINFYKSKIKETCILIGDFNSNAIWDKKKRVGNHSDVVDILNQYGIRSIYHLRKKCRHGEEQDPTLYLLKKKEKPYHMDYCFASKELISNRTAIQIGKFEDWIKLSDHMPVIVENIKVK